MADKTFNLNTFKSLALGMHDAVVGDDIKHDIQSLLVFVPAQADLAKLADYPVGTFAATYGAGTIWQKNDQGEWVEFGAADVEEGN